MEFDAVDIDVPISHEQLAHYWREKAECLGHWVCELLRKNHSLRMALEEGQTREQDGSAKIQNGSQFAISNRNDGLISTFQERQL